MLVDYDFEDIKEWTFSLEALLWIMDLYFGFLKVHFKVKTL